MPNRLVLSCHQLLLKHDRMNEITDVRALEHEEVDELTRQKDLDPQWWSQRQHLPLDFPLSSPLWGVKLQGFA